MNDLSYRMALAHLPRWRNERINELISFITEGKNISLQDFFELNPKEREREFLLSPKETEDLEKVKSELGDYFLFADTLPKQGFEIIPFTSDKYSQTLKKNLQQKYSPPLLYTRGNIKLLHEASVAIVGSRRASETAMEFTQNIAKICAKNYQVVVSGFAKGVDKTALDATLEVNGHSIIVLPQGITTFTSGFKTYEQKLVDGDILILSTFHPNAPWNVGLAMSRNIYIYGLAEKIYVAESDFSGGTWSGVNDGLRKKRTIYVRKPESGEKNANDLLIEKGAIPVDMNGKPLAGTHQQQNNKKEDIVQGKLFE